MKPFQPLLAAGLLALAAACGKPDATPAPPPPTRLALSAEAGSVLNQDAAGEAMSLVVHVVQLKDKLEFQKLTFDVASAGRPLAETLGQDLVAQRETILVPGGRLTETVDLHPQARYVGIVGLFRKPDTHAWRYLVSVEQLVTLATPPPPKTRDEQKKARKTPPVAPLPILSFRADHCHLQITQAKAEPLAGQPLDARPDCTGVVTRPPQPDPPAPAPKDPQPPRNPARPATRKRRA